MNFLLDTHVWIWSLTEPERLNEATRALLYSHEHSFFLSPITVWECVLLIERRRLPVNVGSQEWVETVLGRFPLEEAPLTHTIALRSRALPLPHQDPADRFIAATALEYGLTLITADQYLLNLSGLTTWPAR